MIRSEIYEFVYTWKHMDNADVIHRVLEHKQSLLEPHSVDGAPVYFTYIKYVFETIQLQYKTSVQ